MWPRYGSFPGFNPIVELSLTFHNPVVGANGQRQAMFLENVSGLAERILRNFALSPEDSALVISSSGCNVVPIEMAEEFQRRGVRVVSIISRAHSEASTSRRADGRSCRTSPTSCSTPARPSATRWCASTASTRRSRRDRPSAAACWSTASRRRSRSG